MKYKINYSDVLVFADICKNGEGLSYKEICKILNVQPSLNSSNSKNNILAQLKQFCEIEEIKENGKATKYIIKQIYSQPLVETIHKNNKFQEYIEHAVLTKALAEPTNKLYLSNTEVLYLTSLINKNFKIICNWNFAKQLEDRTWLHSEAATIYSVLYRWLRERLIQMHSRHIIELQRGYRVYKTFTNNKGQEITIKENVKKDSELEEKCKEVFVNAIKHTYSVPKNWKGEWLPPTVYEELQRQVRFWAKKIFLEEGWDNVRTVNVIIPVQNKELLKDSISKVEEILNKESQRKIQNTKQLNHLTGFEREIAIEELIDIHTQVDYLSLLGEF